MANTRKYLNHLLQNTGITPACSEEERAAADIVATIFRDHGFQPEIQEFSASSGGKIAQAVYGILVFVGAILMGVGGSVGLVGLVLTLLGAVLYVLERTGHPMLSQFGNGGLSQNVIAYHQASGPLASPRNRPVVVVAHYDSPRADFLSQAPFASYRPIIVKLLPFAMVVPALIAVACLFPVPVAAKTVLWIIGIVVALVPMVYSVSILANKFILPYTSGSVCNKSSVAAMLGVMDAVAPFEGAHEFPADKPFHEFMEEQQSYAPVEDEFGDFEDEGRMEPAYGDIQPGQEVPAAANTAVEPAVAPELISDQPSSATFELYDDEPLSGATTTMTREDLVAAGLAPVEAQGADADALADAPYVHESEPSVARGVESEPEPEPEPEPTLPRNAVGNLRYGADIIRALGMVGEDCAFSYSADALPVMPEPVQQPVGPAPTQVSEPVHREESREQQAPAFEPAPVRVEAYHVPEPVPATEPVPAPEPTYVPEPVRASEPMVPEPAAEELAQPEASFSQQAYDDPSMWEAPQTLQGEAFEQVDEISEVLEPTPFDGADSFDDLAASVASEAQDIVDELPAEAAAEDEFPSPYQQVEEDTSDYILEAEWEVIEEEPEPEPEPVDAEVEGDLVPEADTEDDEPVAEDASVEQADVAGTVSIDASEMDGATAVFSMDQLEHTAVFGSSPIEAESTEAHDEELVEDELPSVDATEVFEAVAIEQQIDDRVEEDASEGFEAEAVDEMPVELDDHELSSVADASDGSSENGLQSDEAPAEEESRIALDRTMPAAPVIASDQPSAEPAAAPGQTMAVPAAVESRSEQPEAADAATMQAEAQLASRPQRALNIPSIEASQRPAPRRIPSVPGIEALQQTSSRAPLFDLPDPSVKPADPFAPAPASTTSAATRGFSVVENTSAGAQLSSNQESKPEEAKQAESSKTFTPTEKPRRGLARFFGRKKKQQDDSMSGWLGVDDDFDAKRNGNEIGSWDNFDDDNGWKGGAAGPEGVGEDELRDAITSMGDEELLGHDIWFVATGASECGNAGIKAFLDTHRDKLRGVFLINLESVGSGQLAVLASEGEQRVLKGDKRILKLVQRVSADFHHEFGAVDMPFVDTDAYEAMSRSLRSLTIAGIDGSHFACSHSEEDQPYNVDEGNVALVSDVVTEVIRRS